MEDLREPLLSGEQEKHESFFAGKIQKYVENLQYYNQPFLQEGAEPSDFLKEISDNIDLTDLYEVINCAHFSQKQEFCAIAIRVKDEDLKKSIGAPYLLQVWGKESQSLLFEDQMEEPPRVYGGCNNYFWYQPMKEKGEDRSDLRIIDIHNLGSIVQIQNILPDRHFCHSAYLPDSQLMVVAREDRIVFVKFSQDNFSGGSKSIDISKLDQHTINPKLPLKALFPPVFVFETADNQLDFNKLSVEEFTKDSFVFKFQQQAEIVPRSARGGFQIGQEIGKVLYVEKENINYAIAQRGTQFDIYCNYMLKYISEDQVTLDFELSMTSFYFEIKNRQGIIEHYVIEHKDSTAITWEMAEDIKDPLFHFKMTENDDAKDFVNLFKSFQILKAQFSVVAVAHKNFVSVYDIKERRWTKHVSFGDNIKWFYQLMFEEGDVQIVHIILENGDFYYLFTDYFMVVSEDKLYQVEEGQRQKTLKGSLKKIFFDDQRQFYTLMLTQDYNDEMRLYIGFNRVILKVNDFLKERIEPTSNFPILQGLPENSRSFLHQTRTTISKYELTFQGKPERKKETVEDFPSKEQPKVEDEKDIDFSKCADDDYLEVVNLWIQFRNQLKNYHTKLRQKVEGFKCGAITTAMSYKKDGKVYLIFSDRQDLVLYNVLTKEYYIKTDQHIASFIHFSYEDNYALRKCPKKADNGLYYYNMTDIINNIELDDVRRLNFTYIDIGINRQLTFSADECRIGFLNSLNYLTIVPYLHINQIKFMGIRHHNRYLAMKVLKDKFIAFNKNGKIQTWNVLTGKFISQLELGINWAEDYTEQFYMHESKIIAKKKDKVLIVSNQSTGDDYKRFVDASQVKKLLNQQVPYTEKTSPEIFSYKYIEIVNELSINEIFNFKFPKLENQMLYISDDDSIMIQVLKEAAFLFKIDARVDKTVTWVRVRKLQDFYQEFYGNQRLYLPFYSPDFRYHLDMNRLDYTFVIMDTLADEKYKDIPKELMSFDKDYNSIQDQINRIRFLDSAHIRLVNKEGIEKIVNFHNDFEEVAEHTIPLFKDIDVKEGFGTHAYFYERPPLGVNDLDKSLTRKYQAYKSQYNLLKKRDRVSLSEVLFTVERNNLSFNNLSFTYLHWSLVHQIGTGELLISDIYENQMQAMMLNIYPGGNSFLHLFSDNETQDDVLEVFKIAHPNNSDPSEIKYHIPIIKNFKKLSALDLARTAVDYKSLDVMIKYLKFYPLDHHAREIKGIIPHLIEKDLPEMPGYFESRMLQTEFVASIAKVKLVDDYPDVVPLSLEPTLEKEMKEYIQPDVIEKKIKCEFIDLPSVYHYQDKLFLSYYEALASTDNYDYFGVKAIQKMIEFNYALVMEYTVKTLFIPYLLFLLVFVVYFNAFIDTYLDRREFYDVYSVATEIPIDETFVYSLENLYRYEANIIDQLVMGENAIGYMVTFEGVDMLLTDLMTDSYTKSFRTTLGFCLILLLFAVYFTFNELKQLSDGLNAYLTSFWNYIDILPPLGIFANVALLFLNLDGSFVIERVIQSIATFFMWLKLLYFMRLFKRTGYLIRMIVVVIRDMGSFLLVVLIGLIAFGDSFATLAQGNKDIGAYVYTEGFFNSIIYVYLIILGGFDIGDYSDSINYALAMSLFLLCTLFNMIVMLNLLIAIISESFANVNSNAAAATYQEMASLIAENSYLIPSYKMSSYAKKKLHLMVITDLEAVDNEGSDPIAVAMEQSKEEIKDSITSMKSDFEDTKDRMLKTQKEILTDQAVLKKQFQALFQVTSNRVKGSADVNQIDDSYY